MITLDQVYLFLQTSLGKVVAVITVLLFTLILERIIRKVIHNSFKKTSKIIKVDPTRFALLKHTSSALIYLIGIGIAIYIIPTFRTLSVSILAGAGVLAIVLGFAAQKTFSNIISGIFIAIFKPFRVGDIIKFVDKLGTVEDITLRHTVVRNFENKRFIIPNSVISDETIENYDIEDQKICRFVDFGISYDSNINRAMKIVKEEAEKHPSCIDHRTEEEKKEKIPKVVVRVIGFGDSSVNLRAWVWANNPSSAYKMGCDLNKSIKERFDNEGVEIPFPYRTIVYKHKMKKKKGRRKSR